MTPAEWARIAMENAVARGGMARAIEDVVGRAARDARNDEREACARIADAFGEIAPHPNPGKAIAQTIRQRAEPARSAAR